MYLHPFVSRIPVYQILIMFIFIYTYTFSVLIPNYLLFSLICIFYILIKLFKNNNTINERRRLDFTYYIMHK